MVHSLKLILNIAWPNRLLFADGKNNYMRHAEMVQISHSRAPLAELGTQRSALIEVSLMKMPDLCETLLQTLIQSKTRLLLKPYLSHF